jgi:hypothetical protein
MSRTVAHSLILAAICTAGIAYAANAAHAGGIIPTPSTQEAEATAAIVDRLAADRPAIGEENLFRGGQTLSLEGLRAAEPAATHLALVNLAATENRCTLALTGADGAGLGPVTTLTLQGLETRPFVNAFERPSDPSANLLNDFPVDFSNDSAARAAISCEQDFYAYALVADGATGRLDRVTPQEESAAGSLTAPAVPACPAGATCFDAPGVVHVPAPPPGVPVGRVTFPAPAGVAKRLRVSLDVTVADWYKQEPSGKNLIYWFVVNKNIDMPGLLYFRGPNKNQAFARHGMGLTHPQKLKIIKPFAAQVGQTYHVDNDYDMASQTYTVTVTNMATGEVKVTLNGKPNVTSYTIKPGSNFLVDMGFFPNKVPTEVPSYKWKYANVHVEAYMK